MSNLTDKVRNLFGHLVGKKKAEEPPAEPPTPVITKTQISLLDLNAFMEQRYNAKPINASHYCLAGNLVQYGVFELKELHTSGDIDSTDFVVKAVLSEITLGDDLTITIEAKNLNEYFNPIALTIPTGESNVSKE